MTGDDKTVTDFYNPPYNPKGREGKRLRLMMSASYDTRRQIGHRHGPAISIGVGGSLRQPGWQNEFIGG